MPRIPPDQCSPYGTAAAAAAAKRGKEPAETAKAHQRQGDRASGDDDDSAAERLKAEQLKAKLAERRSNLLKSGLPVFYRFPDLVAAGLVTNRATLLRLIDNENFPPGVMIGRNTRVWRVNDIEEWLATRSSARKVTPPDARHPLFRAKRRADAGAQP